jgi:hypothetical protein
MFIGLCYTGPDGHCLGFFFVFNFFAIKNKTKKTSFMLTENVPMPVHARRDGLDGRTGRGVAEKIPCS